MRAPTILYVIALASLLSSCVGMGPSVMGKSNYKVDFVDTVTPEGGQNTEFHSSISAPAGDIAKIDPGATYTWNEGTGKFTVSGRGDIDSTAQADMVTEISRQQAEAFKAGLDAALNSLAPFIGQYLDARVREGEIKAGVANNAIDKLQLKGTDP